MALDLSLRLSKAYDHYAAFGELEQTNVPRITVIGLGGFGNRLVSYLPSHNELASLPFGIRLDYFGLDTDQAYWLHLANGFMPQSIPLTVDAWDDEGSCDGDPSVARRSAWHQRQKLFGLDDNLGFLRLRENDLVILVAGLGGGAGTGLAQSIAHKVRWAGILTVAMVTLPLASESLKVPVLRELQRLRRAADAVITIPQDDASVYLDRPMVSDHDVRAWSEYRLADCIVGLLHSLVRPNLTPSGFNAIRTLFAGAGVGGYCRGNWRNRYTPRNKAPMLFDPMTPGFSDQGRRALVSFEAGTRKLVEDNIQYLTEEIQQQFGGHVTCLLPTHDNAYFPPNSVQARIWWVGG